MSPKKCLTEAIGKGQSDIILEILKTKKVFLEPEHLPEVLKVSVREEHSELLDVAMSYSEKFQLKEYISSVNFLLSKKRIDLADKIIFRLNHPRAQVVEALYILWSQNNKPELLEFIIKHFGFNEADYRSTLLYLSMNRVERVPESLFMLSKMGANLGMEDGLLFKEALAFDNHRIATALLIEGVVCSVNLKMLKTENVKKYIRFLVGNVELKSEGESFLNFLKAQECNDLTTFMDKLLRGEEPEENPNPRIWSSKLGGLTRSPFAKKAKKSRGRS